MKTTITALYALLVLISVGHSIVNADALRTVALSGEPAPGTGSGVLFSTFFSSPVLNDAGQTAFRGVLTGMGVGNSNDSVIWSEGGGTLALVARKGNGVPGTSANFFSFGDPVLNGAGQTAFVGFLTGLGVGDSNNAGIWSEGSGSLALVARAGSKAPGTDANFSIFGSPVLSGLGHTAFWGRITGSGVSFSNNEGVWSEGDGTLALVARKGNRAPGTSGNFTGFNSPVLNTSGQIAFSGSLTGSGVNDSNDIGIWSTGGGTLALVARAGDGAPGTSANFSDFDTGIFRLAFNDAGQTAFLGILSGTGLNSNNRSGIWSERNGPLALVARAGNRAPGTSANFSGFPSTPVLNGAGQTAFRGRLIGLGVNRFNNDGIWSEGGNSLALVAREGNIAPGTSDIFSEFLSSPVLNDKGQIAFQGELTGTEVSSSNDSGIWAQDSSGVLALIVRKGDLFDVDDGPDADFRTISDLKFLAINENEDVRASSFNNLGQLAFSASFTDGTSGIFVSNLVAIPEPATWVLAAMAAIGLFWQTGGMSIPWVKVD